LIYFSSGKSHQIFNSSKLIEKTWFVVWTPQGLVKFTLEKTRISRIFLISCSIFFQNFTPKKHQS